MNDICSTHNAPFKNDVALWCKKSEPKDECVRVAPSERRPPLMAILMLGSRASVPGWLTFLQIANAEGYGINQPGDENLSDEDWEAMAELRVNVLVSAFDTLIEEHAAGEGA